MEQQQQRKGVGFLGLLTLVFVVAKLLNLIAWSWWLVFAPIIIAVSFSLLILVIAVVLTVMSD